MKSLQLMTPFELGETRSKEALPFLAVYLKSGTDNDKRLAASAVLKLVQSDINCYALLPFLIKNIRNDKPQVRQYTLKALKEFILPDDYFSEIMNVFLEDEKDYNKQIAQDIITKFKQHSNMPYNEANSSVLIDTTNTSLELEKPELEEGYIYFIREDFSGRIKIGKAKDLNQRLDTFRVKLPFNIELIHSIKTFNPSYTEKLFHILFDSKKVNGEWFELNEQDIAWVKAGKYTKRVMDSINPSSIKTKNTTIKTKNLITDKQSNFLLSLLSNSRLMLTKPIGQLSVEEGAALIGYLYKGEQLPREMLSLLQTKGSISIGAN